MNKNMLSKTLVMGVIILFLPATTFAFENVSINNCQDSLEVFVEIIWCGRIFDITTYIRNVGDEQVTIIILNMPGGGYEIYNQDEMMVYYTPDYVLLIVWELTLNPGQIKKMYSETWIGVDDYGKKFPGGDYSVIGFVNTEGGDIYSEPINIHLEKAKNMYILEFLNHFPLLVRFLNTI